MAHLNYAINIWLFLNNKGNRTSTRHKRRDDKEKRFGSHMAGWGERSLCVKQPSQAARPARPSGKGVDTMLALLHPAPRLLSQVFGKSRWGDICLRVFWRTIEGVLVVHPDEGRPVTVCVNAAAYSNYSFLVFTFTVRRSAEVHQLLYNRCWDFSSSPLIL